MFMQLLDQTGTICLVCDAGTRASCIPGSIRTPLSLSNRCQACCRNPKIPVGLVGFVGGGEDDGEFEALDCAIGDARAAEFLNQVHRGGQAAFGIG